MKVLVAWRGGLDKGFICVFSILNADRNVCGCMWVYTHTHTLTQRWVLSCEPKSRDETPGGPEESKWTKSRHICICICVQSTHVYVYARRRGEILNQLLFLQPIFPLKKTKADVKA